MRKGEKEQGRNGDLAYHYERNPSNSTEKNEDLLRVGKRKGLPQLRLVAHLIRYLFVYAKPGHSLSCIQYVSSSLNCIQHTRSEPVSPRAVRSCFYINDYVPEYLTSPLGAKRLQSYAIYFALFSSNINVSIASLIQYRPHGGGCPLLLCE